RAVDQMVEEWLGDAGAPLAANCFLELLELVFHQVTDGLMCGLVRLVARTENQVDGVEAALGSLTLVGAQVVGQPHNTRRLADVTEDPVLQLLGDVLIRKGQDRYLDDGEGAAVHAVGQVGVKRDPLLVLEPGIARSWRWGAAGPRPGRHRPACRRPAGCPRPGGG